MRDLPAEPGQPSRTLWLLRDLRERAEIADALRVSEERFRDFAEISSDWLWELGPDLCFTFISDRLRRSGGDPQRVLGTKPGAGAEGPPEGPAWQAHSAVLERHEPFRNFATRRQFPDGSWRVISASGNPLFDTDGAFLGYRGTATDVTARHAAETQLGQANAKLQECIESLAEAFALFGPDDRLLLCNEQFRNLNPAVRELVVPGVRFAAIVKAGLRRGTVPDAVGHGRAWLRSWITERRRPHSMVHRKISDRWFQLNYQRLSDGSTATIEPARGARRRRERQPHEERIPGDHEPRAAHAAQCHPGILRGDARRAVRRARHRALPRLRLGHPPERPSSARHHLRRARHVEARGRPDEGAGRAHRRRRRARPLRAPDARARREPPAAHRGRADRVPAGADGRSCPTRSSSPSRPARCASTARSSPRVWRSR